MLEGVSRILMVFDRLVMGNIVIHPHHMSKRVVLGSPEGGRESFVF